MKLNLSEKGGCPVHKLLGLCCGMLALVACTDGPSKTERGLNYMPDMYVSPALKSQESYVVQQEALDENGEIVVSTMEIPAMMTPPAGTIPRDFMPYDLNDPEIADGMVNPLAAADPSNARLGRDKFEQFCAVCHGKDGNADNGYVAEKLLGVPSLTTPVVAEYTDGRIYHFITTGKGRMPNYKAQLLPQERWAVIHYIRSLNAASLRVDEAQTLDAAGKSFKPLPEAKSSAQREIWPETSK